MSDLIQYANRYGYSDVEPYEIVRFVSDKTVEVRELNAERDPEWKPEWHVGGFAGHCSNQREQRWLFSRNEGSPVFRIRRQKDGKWKCAAGNKFYLSDKPVKFYDYNF